MHINCHVAVGIIIASITHYYVNLTLFQFGFIVLSSFIMDFDIFFSKMARDNNHRMLISHSIIPAVILLVLGLIFSQIVIIMCGIAYFVHVLIDTFDWGTNFLGIHKKPFGPKLLITKEELTNLPEILKEYKISKSFFDFRYYSKKGIVLTEIILFILMIVFNLIFALNYMLVALLYIPAFLFHYMGYKHLKKIEAQ